MKRTVPAAARRSDRNPAVWTAGLLFPANIRRLSFLRSFSRPLFPIPPAGAGASPAEERLRLRQRIPPAGAGASTAGTGAAGLAAFAAAFFDAQRRAPDQHRHRGENQYIPEIHAVTLIRFPPPAGSREQEAPLSKLLRTARKPHRTPIGLPFPA